MPLTSRRTSLPISPSPSSPPGSAPSSHPLLIYDGDCQFCTRSVDWLRKMVGSSFEAVPYQRPGVLDDYPELIEEACREEIKLVFSDSFHVGGAEAVFRLLLRHPLWRLIAWVYYVPPIGWISEWVYRWVARRRRCMLGDSPNSE